MPHKCLQLHKRTIFELGGGELNDPSLCWMVLAVPRRHGLVDLHRFIVQSGAVSRDDVETIVGGKVGHLSSHLLQHGGADEAGQVDRAHFLELSLTELNQVRVFSATRLVYWISPQVYETLHSSQVLILITVKTRLLHQILSLDCCQENTGKCKNPHYNLPAAKSVHN